LGQLDLKNVHAVLEIAAESFSCGHLSGDLDVLLVQRARGGGDGAAACLGMNRTIFPSRMKRSSHTATQYCDLQPAFIVTFSPGSTVSTLSTSSTSPFHILLVFLPKM
jgi:hypothetical protein